MSTMFSYDARVIACENCGGPVDAEPRGGTFTCAFCHAVNRLVPRDDGQILAHNPAPITEQERLNRLRSQDGRPLLPPPSLQALLPGGELPAWKVNEAIQVWNATRKELTHQGGNYDAGERLVILTMALANQFSDQKDVRRQRAMFESALDALTLPRHKQVMRGFLARCAVRESDIAAAERWLAPCDAQSDDLQTDSALRFSRAYIETARGNFAGVLGWIGRDANEIPIEDSMDAVCVVFRANAWERTGRVDVAASQLAAYMSAGGPSGRRAIESIVRAQPQWQLCTASLAAAGQSHAAVAGRSAATRASGGIHKVFVPLGCLMVLATIVLGAVAGASFVASYAGFELPFGDASSDLGSTLGIVALSLLPTGAIFLLVGLGLRRAAMRAERLRLHGIPATGRVESIQPTGMVINGVPRMGITVTVMAEGRAPYRATTNLLLPGRGAELPIGSQVALRIDPQNPNDILIEAD